MKGEVVLILENLGSRWVVFARWTYLSHEDEALQFVTAALGEAPTIDGAKAIAGLFGAATANAVYRLAKDADQLREMESGVFNAAGMADTREIEGAISRAGYDARRSLQNLERLTRPPETAALHDCPNRNASLPPKIVEWGQRCEKCGWKAEKQEDEDREPIAPGDYRYYAMEPGRSCGMCDGTGRTARYGRKEEGEPHIVRGDCPNCCPGSCKQAANEEWPE